MKSSGKKRILVVCQHFWPEEFKINDICRSWVEIGYEVDVLCGIPNYPKGKYFQGYSIFKKRHEEYHGVNVHRAFLIPRGSGNPVQVFLNYITYPIFSIYHILKLARNNYDKVLVYQLTPIFMAYPALLLKKLKKVKVHMYILDLWPESLYSVYNFNSRLYKAIFDCISHNIYKKCDYFLTTSRGIKEKIHKLYNVDRDKILYLPNWAEKLYEERRVNEELREKYKGTFNIMFAGNIGPAQSFDTILNAAKMCYDQGYKDIKWIIVGDGMTKKWVDDRIKELGIEPIVDMVGRKPMSSMPEYYDVADVLLVSLVKSELFGITVPSKIPSYLAAGKPVIASLDGEGGDIIKESGAGFACKAEDEAKLALLVKRMYLLSDSEREAMGEKGYLYYLDNFNKEKLLVKLTNFVFEEE